MAARTPPKYVPTLTEVVKGGAAGSRPAADEEQVVQRVMQRVDVVLERRLRETIAQTVVEQTREIAPALRAEIEDLVREVVAQAFADELTPRGRGRR